MSIFPLTKVFHSDSFPHLFSSPFLRRQRDQVRRVLDGAAPLISSPTLFARWIFSQQSQIQISATLVRCLCHLLRILCLDLLYLIDVVVSVICSALRALMCYPIFFYNIATSLNLYLWNELTISTLNLQSLSNGITLQNKSNNTVGY